MPILTLASHIWNQKDYLAFERANEERHEYFNGEVRKMNRGNANHTLIVGSAAASIYSQLRSRPHKVYMLNLRLKVQSIGFYTYFDIGVTSDDVQLEDEHKDTLLNPTLLIEILSPSTENYDRGEKFRRYSNLDSLQEYLLIAQDTPRIERYLRQANNEWLLTEVAGLDATLELPSIQCTLALVDVYEKVTFGE